MSLLAKPMIWPYLQTASPFLIGRRGGRGEKAPGGLLGGNGKTLKIRRPSRTPAPAKGITAAGGRGGERRGTRHNPQTRRPPPHLFLPFRACSSPSSPSSCWRCC